MVVDTVSKTVVNWDIVMTCRECSSMDREDASCGIRSYLPSALPMAWQIELATCTSKTSEVRAGAYRNPTGSFPELRF